MHNERTFLKRLPRHMKRDYGTLHGFRVEKRRAATSMALALSELRSGCAYTPAYPEIDEIDRLLSNVREKLSVREWGK